MDSRKEVLKETAIVAVGVLIFSALMVGVFAALGYFSLRVVISALVGSAVIILNYFFMAVTVTLAADKAQRGEPAAGQKMIQLSSVVRLVLMGVVLFIGVKAGGNVIALVLPLAFLRPVLMLSEFFRKKGES